MFHICSQAAAEGEGRISGSVEAVPPAAACKRSVGARLAARPAKAGLEEPIVGLLRAEKANKPGQGRRKSSRFSKSMVVFLINCPGGERESEVG